MAISTSAIVDGTAQRVTQRVVKRDGKPDLTFRNVLIIGEHTLAEVTLADQLAAPLVGEVIRGRVTIDVYRDNDQLRLEEYL